ncbi:MAG: DMT family transporter [Dermatophilaceae bacterium]
MSQPRVAWQVKFLLLAVIWGSSFLLMKVALAALHPIQIAAVRIVAGALILSILLRATGSRLPRERRVWGHLAVSSVFLTALPFTGFVVGETRVASAIAGIGNATTPIAAVLFALVLLPSERLTPAKLAAVVLGFVGVVVIAEPWNGSGRPDPLGFLIVVLSGACYGLGWTYNRRFLAGADLGGLSQPTALLLCGSVLMLPTVLGWWLLDRESVARPWSLMARGEHAAYPIPIALLCVAALGFVGTGVAYMLQYDVVRAAGAVVSTTVTYLIPVVSILLGVLVLGEHLAFAQVGGFLLVLAAAWIINRRPRATA